MTRQDYDVVVVGSGVSALAAAMFAANYGLRTVVQAELILGGQVLNTEQVSNYPGLEGPVSGADLCAVIEAQAREAGVEFLYDRASSVRREPRGFVVTSELGDTTCRAVVVATGSSPRSLGLPGEASLQGRGVSHCASCDGGFFGGQQVAVIGGGDSAADAALLLAGSVSEVTMVVAGGLTAMWATQERVRSDPRIRVLTECEPVAIDGDQAVTGLILRDRRSGQVSRLPVTGVFVYAGSVPNTELLAPLLDLEASGHVRTNADMETLLPGLLAVGDIRVGFQGYLINAASEGAVAAATAARRLKTHP